MRIILKIILNEQESFFLIKQQYNLKQFMYKSANEGAISALMHSALLLKSLRNITFCKGDVGELGNIRADLKTNGLK